MKQEIVKFLSTINNDIFNLSKYLYDNPEESFSEFKACAYLCNIYKKHGFLVKENFLDMPTAFYAEFGKGHPKICFFCEYDAVKDNGHITGHNLISSMSTAAALSLSKIIEKIGGTVIVVGCPGEFVGSSKVTMCRQGIFDDIDVGLMAHPDVITAESGTSMALIPIKITYKSSEGFSYMKSKPNSALDGSLFTFNSLNLLSKSFGDSCSIDGVIVNGGSAPYLLPSECESKFYIRAKDVVTANKVYDKIHDLVNITSNLMNLNGSVNLYGIPYAELITNSDLSRIFSHNLKESGIIDISSPRDTFSGLSLGSVSHVIPCIHPYISIIETSSVKYSSKEFAKATISTFAHDRIMKAAQALAFTGLDLLENESMLREVKENFFNKKRIITP